MNKFSAAVVFGVFIFLAAALGALTAAQNPDPRYNEVRQKASHNSYQRGEDVMSQLLYHHVRTIEFDARARRKPMSFQNPPPGDWPVFHNNYELASNCEMLSDCLKLASSFHRAVPRHEVVTVFFDLDLAEPLHTRIDFNRLVERTLPENSIFTPADLLSSCQGADSLKEAVSKCGWPRLSNLRGKFILVIAGGAEKYSKGYDYKQDVAFVRAENSLSGEPIESPDRVFVNLEGPRPVFEKTAERGLVNRAYYLDDPERFAAAKQAGAHLLATDTIDVGRYPWSSTHNKKGYPFEPVDPGMDLSGLEEDVDAANFPIGGKAREARVYEAGEKAAVWNGWIVGSSERRDRGARGCLIAMTEPEAGVPFLAICKGANGPVNAAWRLEKGGRVKTRVGKVAPPEIDQRSAVFVKLIVEKGGCGRALGSVDGKNYIEVADECFGSPLSWQGIAAEGDGDGTEIIFGNITREEAGEIESMTSLAKPAAGAVLAIGDY